MSRWGEAVVWLPKQRTVTGRLSFEASLVVIGVGVISFGAEMLSARTTVDGDYVYFVLALLAACVGTAAVSFGHTAGQLLGNRRAVWLIPALALYSVAVIPRTVLPERQEASIADVGMVINCLLIAAFLLAAIWPPPRAGAGMAWSLAVGGAFVGFAVDQAYRRTDGSAAILASPAAVGTAVLLAWCTVSTAVVVAGYRAASPPLWRVGLGFGVIAAAHLLRALRPEPVIDPRLSFSALRLFGVLVVMLGMAQLLRRTLNIVLTERTTHQEELRVASIRTEQIVQSTVEREHELRNGLTGLAGVTSLLEGGADDERARRARSAVISELHRLTELLDGHTPSSAAGRYSVSEVVEELVALWRMKGMDLDCSVPRGLLAAGRPAVLAEVMTNVLSNCARHAPGAPVRVLAWQVGNKALIQVRDSGPGLPEPGAASSTAGSGLGLQISRRLLEAEGGELWVHRPDPQRPGCTVSIDLVAQPRENHASPQSPAGLPAPRDPLEAKVVG